MTTQSQLGPALSCCSQDTRFLSGDDATEVQHAARCWRHSEPKSLARNQRVGVTGPDPGTYGSEGPGTGRSGRPPVRAFPSPGPSFAWAL